MKEVLVPIDKAGRVVLPKDLRQKLDIKAGDFLKISIDGDEVTLRPTRKSGFIKRGRALVFSTDWTDLLDNETVDSLLTNRARRIKLGIAKGLPSQKHNP